MESFETRKGSSQIKYGPHSTGGSINYHSGYNPQKLDFKGTISYGDQNKNLQNLRPEFLLKILD